MSYGSRIKEIRQGKNITAKELADKMEVTPSFISAIEKNSTKLSLKTLEKICLYLDISVTEFFNDSLSITEKQLVATIKKMPKKKQLQLLAFLTNLTYQN